MRSSGNHWRLACELTASMPGQSPFPAPRRPAPGTGCAVLAHSGLMAASIAAERSCRGGHAAVAVTPPALLPPGLPTLHKSGNQPRAAERDSAELRSQPQPSSGASHCRFPQPNDPAGGPPASPPAGRTLRACTLSRAYTRTYAHVTRVHAGARAPGGGPNFRCGRPLSGTVLDPFSIGADLGKPPRRVLKNRRSGCRGPLLEAFGSGLQVTSFSAATTTRCLPPTSGRGRERAALLSHERGQWKLLRRSRIRHTGGWR